MVTSIKSLNKNPDAFVPVIISKPEIRSLLKNLSRATCQASKLQKPRTPKHLDFKPRKPAT